MPEKILIENCSPALAGLKTANMISLRYENREDALKDISEMNEIFRDKGMRAVPLRFTKGHVLLYLYRPAMLKHDMERAETRDFLESLGYTCSNPDLCVSELAKRVRENQEFPHEIGLFLGYPYEDVKGFIEHKNEGCKTVGFWRVYSDADEALRTFDRYRNCTRIYEKCWEKGRTIDQLTVRTKINTVRK